MHTDLDEKMIARRLRAAGDASSEAPYDWAEFQRRRQGPMLSHAIERHRPAAIAAAVLAALLMTTAPFLHWSRVQTPVRTPARAPARAVQAVQAGTHDWQQQARTRAIEGWLQGLPHDRALVRVGTHAAVTGLQDQIAALDDLMSSERVAGARSSRLDALEQQRAQLVSSLAQLQYAEMLASANP